MGNFEGSHLTSTKNGIAIIVDVLRASTTIPITMQNGMNDFYIAKEVEDTRLAGKELDTLLMGERGCIKLPDFNYGNSPTEMYSITKFTKEAVTFTSSTGSRRVVEAIGSQCIIIGSIINAQAVASFVSDFISTLEKEPLIVIIPAFTEGSIISNEITEDQIGALIIAREFEKQGIVLDNEIKNEIDFLNDLLTNKKLSTILEETSHGQKLVKLNFKQDIATCAKENQINAVPKSMNEIITLSNNKSVVHMKK
jgi:2-phosphosulfolactate phosphatase